MSTNFVVVSYLGKVPWDALELLFSQLDLTFKSAIGVGVALVELKVALISEKAASGLGQDFPDALCGDHCG